MKATSHPYLLQLLQKHRKLLLKIQKAKLIGSFYTNSEKRQRHLLQLLQRYKIRLDGLIHAKVAFSSLSLGLMAIAGSPANAQSFTFNPIEAPFGLTDIGLFSAPTFVDIDGDGDFDSFVGESNGTTKFFQNTGSFTDPAFSLSVATTPYGITDVGNFSAPTFIDIDSDGDFDVFIGNIDGEISFFENIGTKNAPSFSLSTSAAPFGLSDIGDYASPTFADIDGDGDFDAFVGKNDGNIYFFENTGSINTPAFAAPITNSPFGLADVGVIATPSFIDIDHDGDLDAFIGSNNGKTKFFLNVGNSSSPLFSPSSDNTPYGLSANGSQARPTFVDIDGDGDLDAFIGEFQGNINFFAGTNGTANLINNGQLGLTDIGYNSAPTFVDIDGDGDFDAFVGEEDGNINFFENTGSSFAPAFSLSATTLPFGLSDVGVNATPTFVDIDGDGDFDAFVGEEDGNINFFLNGGSSNAANFYLSVTSPTSFGLSDVGDDSTPTFVDIDGDGDFDAFVGEKDGNISFFCKLWIFYRTCF